MKQAAADIVFTGKERPVKDVPVIVLVVLLLSLSIQIVFQAVAPLSKAEARPLPLPPRMEVLTLAGLSDTLAISRMTMLWLQAFDNQPGISIPFTQLDYDRLIDWLALILDLDQRTRYPLLAAARVYSEVPDEAKKRKMLEFVYEEFFEDPDQRWPALAHAVYVAKHRLNDLPLALKYANAMANQVKKTDVPFWVRQMNIYVLEDMNEIDSARILIGGLIDSGTISDEHELKFLLQRLEQLEQQESLHHMYK